MHFAVGGVHVCDVFVANAVHHNKVIQHLFYDNVGDGGQRNHLQRLGFGTNPFGLEPQFACSLNHAQHVSAFLIGKSVLPNASNGECQPVMGTYRGQRCRSAIGDVLLLNFYAFVLHVC